MCQGGIESNSASHLAIASGSLDWSSSFRHAAHAFWNIRGVTTTRHASGQLADSSSMTWPFFQVPIRSLSGPLLIVGVLLVMSCTHSSQIHCIGSFPSAPFRTGRFSGDTGGTRPPLLRCGCLTRDFGKVGRMRSSGPSVFRQESQPGWNAGATSLNWEGGNRVAGSVADRRSADYDGYGVTLIGKPLCQNARTARRIRGGRIHYGETKRDPSPR